ncbi:MAG: VOC family protein [Alphaproteobacteria bacterium]
MNTESKSAAALAHLRLSVSDLSEAVSFFEVIGAREDVRRGNFAVVEFRDHTRLQLTQSDAALPAMTPLQFDFKVEDIDAAWRDYDAQGLNPEEIKRQTPGHDSFIVNGPDKWEVKINSGYKAS